MAFDSFLHRPLAVPARTGVDDDQGSQHDPHNDAGPEGLACLLLSTLWSIAHCTSPKPPESP